MKRTSNFFVVSVLLSYLISSSFSKAEEYLCKVPLLFDGISALYTIKLDIEDDIKIADASVEILGKSFSKQIPSADGHKTQTIKIQIPHQHLSEVYSDPEVHFLTPQDRHAHNQGVAVKDILRKKRNPQKDTVVDFKPFTLKTTSQTQMPHVQVMGPDGRTVDEKNTRRTADSIPYSQTIRGSAKLQGGHLYLRNLEVRDDQGRVLSLPDVRCPYTPQ